MKIANFNKMDDGSLIGALETLILTTEIALRPVDGKSNDNAPDYRAYSGDREVGAGWTKTSQGGNPYLSIELDDPSFAQPIHCRMTQNADDGSYTLWWDRKKPKSGAAF